jgi:hypothetical protein
MDFSEILHWKFLLEFVDMFQFWLKLDKNEVLYEERKGSIWTFKHIYNISPFTASARYAAASRE